MLLWWRLPVNLLCFGRKLTSQSPLLLVELMLLLRPVGLHLLLVSRMLHHLVLHWHLLLMTSWRHLDLLQMRHRRPLTYRHSLTRTLLYLPLMSKRLETIRVPLNMLRRRLRLLCGISLGLRGSRRLTRSRPVRGGVPRLHGRHMLMLIRRDEPRPVADVPLWTTVGITRKLLHLLWMLLEVLLLWVLLLLLLEIASLLQHAGTVRKSLLLDLAPHYILWMLKMLLVSGEILCWVP